MSLSYSPHFWVKLTSCFPSLQFPLIFFSSPHPTQFPASSANDRLSSVSQMQPIFLHPLHHYHSQATAITHLSDCDPFLLILLRVVLSLQSASKMSFQNCKPGSPHVSPHQFHFLPQKLVPQPPNIPKLWLENYSI